MSEPEDFIDADPFDPEMLAKFEEAIDKLAEDAPNEAKAMIERRRLAYARVFTPGNRTQDDIDVVLADLMWFCKVRLPTYDVRDGAHAESLSKRKEGRREVFHRIEDFSRLNHDALLLMYTDATTR